MPRFTRFPTLFTIALLFIFEIAGAQTPQSDNRPRTASISGRVTIAGKPAANVRIAVTEVTNPSPGSQGFSMEMLGVDAGADHVVLTDADGFYRVTGLPEGVYRAQAQLRGYVREKPSLNESLVETTMLKEGESRENVDFALVRGDVITGRVTDANGRPLIAMEVRLQSVDEQGEKTDIRVPPYLENMLGLDMFQTDDRGVYRIFGLRAGRYLVSAGGNRNMALLIRAGGEYPRVWYPDATDEKEAKIIEVNAGDEITGVDLRLGVASKTYDATGRVVDDETGKPIAGASVICLKSRGADEGAGPDGFGGNSRTDEHGNFRFSGLTPGQYWVGFGGYEGFLTGGGGIDYYSEGSRFEIQGADAGGVEIRAKRGATISGVVVTEDADPSAKPNLSQTVIVAYSTPPLQPSSQDEPGSQAIAKKPIFSRIGSNGGFSLKGVWPGNVTIQVMSLTGGPLKIMRIERDGVDVSEGIIVGAGHERISGVRIILAK